MKKTPYGSNKAGYACPTAWLSRVTMDAMIQPKDLFVGNQDAGIDF